LADDADCVASLQQAHDAYRKNKCESPEVLSHIEELLALHGEGEGSEGPAAGAGTTTAAASK
jgi:hypothetical protein